MSRAGAPAPYTEQPAGTDDTGSADRAHDADPATPRTATAGTVAPETASPGGLPDVPAGFRVAVVAAEWHSEVVEALLAGSLRVCERLGLTPTVLRVPGTVELTVAAERLARSGVDAIVALGVVVRGGTPHFGYVCQAATHGLTEVSLRHGVPVGFGVLTCDTDEQARDRSGLPGSKEDKGAEAAEAAIVTALRLSALGV